MGLNNFEKTLCFDDNVFMATVNLTPAMDMRKFVAGAFQYIHSGGLSATFRLLGSVDGVTFSDTGMVIPPISGTANDYIINMSNIGFGYVKLEITGTAGVSNIKVWFSAKEG